MSQRDGFAGGFLAGAIFGSIVGGVVGAVLVSRRKSNSEEDQSLLRLGKGRNFESEEGMELERRRIEDKIAELNLTLDDFRHRLGIVNGNSSDQD